MTFKISEAAAPANLWGREEAPECSCCRRLSAWCWRGQYVSLRRPGRATYLKLAICVVPSPRVTSYAALTSQEIASKFNPVGTARGRWGGIAIRLL